jgi:hypothetical protein
MQVCPFRIREPSLPVVPLLRSTACRPAYMARLCTFVRVGRREGSQSIAPVPKPVLLHRSRLGRPPDAYVVLNPARTIVDTSS